MLRRLLFIAFMPATLMAQNTGTVPDNFMPVNGMLYNPAYIVDQRPWIDFNLIGFNAFARNNVVYAPKTTYLGLGSTEDAGYNFNPENFNLRAHGDGMMPALSIAIGRNSFAIHGAVRVAGNIGKIPSILGKELIEGDSTVSAGVYPSKNARIKYLGWEEYGLTYGRMAKTKMDNMYNAAITLKRVYAFAQGGFRLKSADFDVDTASNVAVLKADGQYSYARSQFPDWRNGKGIGLNLGVMYKKMEKEVDNYMPHTKRSACISPKYLYRIGASLNDIGFIRMKNRSFTGTINENTPFEDLGDEDGLNQGALLNQRSRYSVWLPSMLHIDVDYNVYGKFYFYGSITQRLVRPGWRSPERSNVLVVAPRFESRFFHASLPVSMYEYTKPQLGLNLRLGYISVGTDNFWPLLFKSDIYGGSAFLYINYHVLKHYGCKEKTRERRRPNFRKDSCPQM